MSLPSRCNKCSRSQVTWHANRSCIQAPWLGCLSLNMSAFSLSSCEYACGLNVLSSLSLSSSCLFRDGIQTLALFHALWHYYKASRTRLRLPEKALPRLREALTSLEARLLFGMGVAHCLSSKSVVCLASVRSDNIKWWLSGSCSTVGIFALPAFLCAAATKNIYTGDCLTEKTFYLHLTNCVFFFYSLKNYWFHCTR